jgi:hypothetical protein
MGVLLLELPGKRLMENQRQFRKIAVKAELAFRRGNFHSAVAWAQIAARFAWERHPGFYCDLTLESLLTEIAQKVDERSVTSFMTSQILPREKSPNKVHILHVITGCQGFGGHTLVVAGWIRNTLDTAVHSIVATGQRGPLPLALSSLAKTSGGWCQQLAKFSSNLLDRSLLLRHFGSWADLIAIHVNPSDALPIVAFGVEGGPPVVLYNHADEVFWLGVSIADVVLDLHPLGQSQTLKRRGVQTSKILPIPLNEPPQAFSYEGAREQLGIKPSTTFLLTVGRECKYLPIGGHDFLGVVFKILKKHSNVVFLAIGPENRGRWAKVSAKAGGRIIPKGWIEWENLSPFYDSADIFLDSFPIGTGTAFLEAGNRGIPTIGLQFKEAPSITEGTDDVAFGNLNEFPSSVEEYTSLLEQMIAEPFSFREKAGKLKELIAAHHLPPGWNRYLDNVMRQLPSRHAIRIPKNLDSDIEPVDNLVADWDAKVLSNETVQQTYARLILSYATQLQKAEMLQEQTGNFLSEFLKIPSFGGFKRLLYDYKKGVLASSIDYPEVL